jgi:hypothetical protein
MLRSTEPWRAKQFRAAASVRDAGAITMMRFCDRTIKPSTVVTEVELPLQFFFLGDVDYCRATSSPSCQWNEFGAELTSRLSNYPQDMRPT